MSVLWQDLRFAVRQLRRNPVFTAVAVTTLALGIGANSAIFSVVNGVLLQPLRFWQEQRLVRLTDFYPPGAFAAMRSGFRTMELAAIRDTEGNLTGAGDPLRLHGDAVSANLFSVLGVQSEAGRTFVEGEDEAGKDNVVILSHSLARQVFGGENGVVGRTVQLGGVNRQIVGILPDNFELAPSNPQFWVPLHLDPRDPGNYWGSGFMSVIGRLRGGTTVEQANAELRAQVPQLRGMFPWKMPDALWAAVNVISLRDSIVGDIKTKLLVLFSAISLVLLIACANVANLLLARSAVREKEITMRTALGASRWRVCRQLIAESVLLGAIGGLVAIILTVVALPLTKKLLPLDTPRLASVVVDWPVVAYTAAVAILTGIVFGIVPAFHSSSRSLSTSGWQQSATRVGQRLRNSFAIAELALAIVLMVGAGLLMKSLWLLSHVPAGFRPESVLTARVTPNVGFCNQASRCRLFFNDLAGRIQAHPGVEGAALVNVLPLSGRSSGFAADLEDHPRDPRDAAQVLIESVVSPSYFDVLKIPVLRGRGFTVADMNPEGPPVAIISDATAKKYWPNQDAVGKHLKRVYDKGWVTVIGVVADVSQYSLAARLPDFANGAVYRPYGNDSRHGPTEPPEMTVVVRTGADPASLAADLRRIVASVNSEVPISEVQMFDAVVARSLAAPRSTMLLFLIFAAVALALGAVGVYGVVSYGVVQRVREIGVRIALGAAKRDVIWMVLRQGGKLAVAGAVLGVVGSLLAGRVMSSLLFAVSTTDLLTYIAVGILLVAVTLVATFIPARRAAKVDPMVALRYE